MVLHEMFIDYKVIQRHSAQPASQEVQQDEMQVPVEQGTLRKPPLLQEFAGFWAELKEENNGFKSFYFDSEIS